MTIRPIIFSTTMVKALIAGRKTQTRRLATSPLRKCEIGDLLYVREGWRPVHSADQARGALYMADRTNDQTLWRPSIHMPRWASRITLQVNNVRTHRLREISDLDARAEGFDPDPNVCAPWHAFLDYWNELHGEGATDANPTVVALSFVVHQKNVDAMASEAA